MITKDQFEYWRSLPATEAILEEIKKEEREIMEYLALGKTLDMTSMERSMMETAKLVGRLRGLRSLLNIEYE